MDQCSDGFLPVSRLRKRTGTDTDVCGSKDGGSGGGCGEIRRDGRERAERGLPSGTGECADSRVGHRRKRRRGDETLREGALGCHGANGDYREACFRL